MQTADHSSERDRLYDIALIPAGVALNVAIAITVSTLRLPLFADAIGTLTVVLMSRRGGMGAILAGAFVGVFSFILIGLFVNPTIIAFSHVQVAITVYAYYVIRPLVRQMELYQRPTVGSWIKLILAGIGLGIVAAILSAPVAALLFSGITPNGPGAVVALLIASGQSLYKAVIAGGLSIEPIDKTIQTLVAVIIYLASPWRTRRSDEPTR